MEFSYNDPMASKEIDRIVKSWKQTFRVNTGLVGNKVTMEYCKTLVFVKSYMASKMEV